MAEQGPFRRGEILTAQKLNEAFSGRPIAVSGSGRLSRDAKGDVVTIDQPETIYLRLTGKTGTTPIKYSWKEVYRNAAGAWINTDRTGTTSGDYAIELNNSDLSTTDNLVYRAERSPESGEWLFFLRRKQSLTANYTIRYKVDSVFANMPCGNYDLYNYQKHWGRTPVVTPQITTFEGCSGNVTYSSTIATFSNITFWYEPDSTGMRRTLDVFENNGTTPSPIGTIFSSNLTVSDIPGKIGVDLVYNDGSFWGYTYSMPCGDTQNCLVHNVANGTAETTANKTITLANYNSTADFSIPASVTPSPVKPNDLVQPPSRHISFVNSYVFSPEPADGYPPGLAAWANAISQALLNGCNISPTKDMTSLPICQNSFFAFSGQITIPDATECSLQNTILGVTLNAFDYKAGPVYTAANKITGSVYGVNTDYEWSYLTDDTHGAVLIQQKNLVKNSQSIDCVIRKTFLPTFETSSATIGFSYVYKDQFGTCNRIVVATYTITALVS